MQNGPDKVFANQMRDSCSQIVTKHAKIRVISFSNRLNSVQTFMIFMVILVSK